MRAVRLDKSPNDDLPYNFNFSDEDVFASPNPITTATLTDWDGNAITGITVGSPAISSPIVQVQISGGTAGNDTAKGTKYLVKCKATNARGDDRDGFLELTVRLPDRNA